MKRLLSALFLLLLSALACGARKLPANALGSATYEIRYTWGAIDAKVATITLSLDPKEWEGTPAYHYNAIIKTSAIFRLFIGTDMTAESYLAESDLQPLFFRNPHRSGGKDLLFEFVYDRKGNEIRTKFVGPKSTDEKTWPLDGKTYDLLSLIAFVRFRDASDKPVTINLLLNNNSYPATLTYQGLDTKKFPGVEAERFLLQLTERGVMENGSGKELLFWRAPGPDRKILGLEAPLNPGFMSIRVKE